MISLFVSVHERLDLITEKYETLANSMTGSIEKPEKLYLEKLEKVDGHSSEGADNTNVSSKGIKKPCKSVTMSYPVGIYMFKVNNRNTRTRCEISSKLTIKTPEWRRSGVFIIDFEYILHLVLMFLLLTLNM